MKKGIRIRFEHVSDPPQWNQYSIGNILNFFYVFTIYISSCSFLHHVVSQFISLYCVLPNCTEYSVKYYIYIYMYRVQYKIVYIYIYVQSTVYNIIYVCTSTIFLHFPTSVFSAVVPLYIVISYTIYFPYPCSTIST